MAIIPAVSVLICYNLLAPLLGSLIVIFIFICITAGLHLDGFADTIDGLYGGKDKEEILAIMRDNHIGSMGVIGIIFIILFKVVFLSEVWREGGRYAVAKVILLFPVIGRWSMVGAAWLMPYARSGEGIGEAFAREVTVREWIFSTLLMICITSFILKRCVFLFLPLVFLTSFMLLQYFRRRVGGVTGDIFGAINELVEVISLGYLLFLIKSIGI